jgi:hypothetical protein
MGISIKLCQDRSTSLRIQALKHSIHAYPAHLESQFDVVTDADLPITEARTGPWISSDFPVGKDCYTLLGGHYCLGNGSSNCSSSVSSPGDTEKLIRSRIDMYL